MSDQAKYYMQIILPVVVLFFCMWLFFFRPQKKKDNAIREMRNNLQQGDEIVTIGGIVGKVMTVKEDSIILYCGADKTKMEFKKWAISEVTKKSEKAEKESAKEPVSEEAALTEESSVKKKIKKLSKKTDGESADQVEK